MEITSCKAFGLEFDDVIDGNQSQVCHMHAKEISIFLGLPLKADAMGEILEEGVIHDTCGVLRCMEEPEFSVYLDRLPEDFAQQQGKLEAIIQETSLSAVCNMLANLCSKNANDNMQGSGPNGQWARFATSFDDLCDETKNW